MQNEEEKDDVLDMTLTDPDQTNKNTLTPMGPSNDKDNNENKDQEMEYKRNGNVPNSDPPHRQSNESMSESKTSPRNPFDESKDSIINNCAVLIIPLDNRVTPQMVVNKFVKYGKILQVRPIKKSSTCIVIFSKASEASNCIRLFESHDKVRVTRPDQDDWNMCGDSIATTPIATVSGNTVPVVKVEKVESVRLNEEKEAVDDKIANYETQQCRITIMYEQRHAYQMLFENDEIETRKRLKNNKLMINRIETMSATSSELYSYLRRMIDLEIKHEENIHKTIINTFGLSENGGSVHSAGIAIDALLKNRYSQFNDINDRVFKNILLASQKYESKTKTQMSYFQNRIKKFNDKINESKTKLSREWNKYQNILNRTLKSQQLKQIEGNAKNKQVSIDDGSHGTLQSDPFLIGKSYALVQNEYKLSLIEYNEEMSRLFNKVIVEDKKRIDGIKNILIDYFLAEKAKGVNHVKLIDSSLEYIKCIDKESDTNDFVKRFGHIQQPISSVALSSSDHKTEINQSKLKKSVSQPIITSKGATLTQTPEGVLIRGASASPSQHTSFNFSESETFALHSKELTSLIYTDVIKRGKIYRPGRFMSSNWKPIYGNITKFGFFHAFEKRKDIKPILSIYLNNKHIIIQIKDNDKKHNLFSFEITVPNASWFSLTGTPTKYLYRAENYKECCEWITNLKNYAN